MNVESGVRCGRIGSKHLHGCEKRGGFFSQVVRRIEMASRRLALGVLLGLVALSGLDLCRGEL